MPPLQTPAATFPVRGDGGRGAAAPTPTSRSSMCNCCHVSLAALASPLELRTKKPKYVKAKWSWKQLNLKKKETLKGFDALMRWFYLFVFVYLFIQRCWEAEPKCRPRCAGQETNLPKLRDLCVSDLRLGKIVVVCPCLC